MWRLQFVVAIIFDFIFLGEMENLFYRCCASLGRRNASPPKIKKALRGEGEPKRNET